MRRSRLRDERSSREPHCAWIESLRWQHPYWSAESMSPYPNRPVAGVARLLTDHRAGEAVTLQRHRVSRIRVRSRHHGNARTP